MHKLVLVAAAVVGFFDVARAVTQYTENGYTYYQLSDGVYCGTTKLCTGGSVIVGYTTTATANVDLAVPSKLGGLPVVAIYTDDFKSKDWLRTLRVPASVRAIKDGAFSACTNLVSASLAGDVYSLKRTYTPSGDGLGTKVDVSEWAPSALFYKCSALFEIALNGKAIGSQAFADCRNLTAVHFGDALESIGSQAFLRSGLKSLDIPATVKAVYSEAFDGCASLESVRFETGARIGEEVKWGAGTVTDWNSYIFAGCTNLKSVVFSEGQEYVGESMFSGCTALENVTLSSTITNIYGSAFYNCTKLPKISIPSSVNMVGDSAFLKCSALADVEFAEGLTCIGSWGFRQCGIKRAVLPSTLKEMGSYAFEGCKNLAAVVFRAPVMGGDARDSQRLYLAFGNCPSLKSVRFAEGQEFIGDSMFASCTSLESVYLPNSITNIGTSAFYTCESLKNITLPSQLKELGGSVFQGCKSLERIEIPSQMKEIPYRAFINCANLREVVLPEGLETVGDYAFYGCTSLRSVSFHGPLAYLGTSAFGNCPSLHYVSFGTFDAPTKMGSNPFSGSYKKRFRIYAAPSSKGWTGDATETGFPSDSLWNGQTLADVASLPAHADAPWDFYPILPTGSIGYQDYTWPTALMISTNHYVKGETLPSSIALSKVLQGDPILLSYAFDEYWRCESFRDLDIKVAFTLSGTEKHETEMTTYVTPDWSEKGDGILGWVCTNMAIRVLQNLEPGSYGLTMNLNADRNFAETDYSNNAATIFFTVLARPSYKVTFNANGGTVTETSRTVYEGKALGTLPTPTAPKGWAFKGWYTADGKAVTAAATVSAALTLSARWAKFDLVFSAPSGWTQAFFLAKDENSRTPVTSFRAGEAIYANFGFGNSFADSYSRFLNCISLGSTTVWSEYYTSSTVFDGAETYYYTKNILLSDLQDLPPGTYTLDCTLNAMGGIEETDASNNTRAVTFTVLPADAAGGRLCEDVGDVADLSAVTTYSGYLVDGDGWVAGTIQVKAAKAKTNRKTGVTTSKLSITIQPAGGKKISLKGDLDVDAGAISITAKDGRTLDLEIGADGIAGTFGDWEIDGARDVFSSKASADKAVAADALAKWQGTTLALLFDVDGGYLTVTVAARGRVKVSGTLSDGTKLNASAQMVVGGEWFCVPVVFTKRDVNLAFCLWLSADGETADVTGLGDDFVLGRPGALGAGAAFSLPSVSLASVLCDDTYADYFPDGVSVEQKGAKWVVADGAKAGKVVLGRDGLVDEAKAGANPSALKLSYRAKDGTFSGSFKAYVDSRGKPKAVTVKVSGVVIDGVGYGTATAKRWSIPVTIE